MTHLLSGSVPVVCNDCDTLCEYGHVMGNDGCPQCECQSAPNPWMPCEVCIEIYYSVKFVRHKHDNCIGLTSEDPDSYTVCSIKL